MLQDRDEQQNEIVALNRIPYEDPAVEERHERLIYAISERSLPVKAVHFGVLSAPTVSSQLGRQTSPSHHYSIEWKWEQAQSGRLEFDYNNQAFRIKLGDSTRDIKYNIIYVKLTNITKIGRCWDFGSARIFFDTLCPPFFESAFCFPSETGNAFQDSRKVRDRTSGLDDAHKRVSPYCSKLMVTLYDTASEDILQDFQNLCKTAEVPNSLIRDARAIEVVGSCEAGLKLEGRSYVSICDAASR
ncbi:hypothetical protein PM082_013548 [Marasmius tenuissimus]|nr:hypothetical protein PM082_013548 [Marasmius tenuissimus]